MIKTVVTTWWMPFISALMVLPAAAGQPDNYVPLLDARVESLVFYESGEGFPPKQDRVYRKAFESAKSRYINWELNITYPKPGRRVDFPIHYKYYDPLGRMLTEYDIDSYVEAQWVSSNHSGGYKLGTWAPGTYRVDLYIGGDMVTTGYFEVILGDETHILPADQPGTEIDIPDDLGEL
jgi:hypothetical protein